MSWLRCRISRFAFIIARLPLYAYIEPSAAVAVPMIEKLLNSYSESPASLSRELQLRQAPFSIESANKGPAGSWSAGAPQVPRFSAKAVRAGQGEALELRIAGLAARCGGRRPRLCQGDRDQPASAVDQTK